ncbi:MAG: GNAT family N-acetyltransferase [Bacteroidota bacterium]
MKKTKDEKLIDDNFKTHSTKIPSLSAGMEVYESDHIYFVDSGLSCDTFNIIHITDGNLVSLQDIEEAVNHFKKRGYAFCLWIQNGNLNDRISKWVSRLSLSKQNEELGMILDLDKIEKYKSKGVCTIKHVDSPILVRQYAQVVAGNWNPPDQNIIDYYSLTSNHYLDKNSGSQLFLNFYNGIPVSTLELSSSNKEVVGIYGFSTTKQYQGLGLGSELLRHALNYCKDGGYKKVVLQATDEALGIYNKIGFREITNYIEFS